MQANLMSYCLLCLAIPINIQNHNAKLTWNKLDKKCSQYYSMSSQSWDPNSCCCCYQDTPAEYIPKNNTDAIVFK